MKKKNLILMVTSILACTLTIYFTSCKKTGVTQIPAKQGSVFETTVIKVSSTTDIRVSAVSDSAYKIVRKVEYINHLTNAVMATFIQTIASDNTTITQSLKDKVFNGTFTVTDGANHPLLIQSIKSNKVATTAFTSDSKKVFSGDPCSFSGIHECVAGKIDDMSFTEYVLCAVSAPECYGGLWVICGARC